MEKTIYSKEFIRKRSSEIIEELKAVSICGIKRFIKRLEIAPDDEEFLDILAQGRLALILSNNGVSGINMEPSIKGPDTMVASERDTFYLEIKRRRPKEEDYKIAESGGPSWMRPDRDENIISLIADKSNQLPEGEMNIKSIWSNTAMVGHPEIEEACKSISKEILENKDAYAKLSGVIFVQDVKIDLTLPDDIYLFINAQCWARILPDPLVGKLSSFCRRRYTIQQFLECP